MVYFDTPVHKKMILDILFIGTGISFGTIGYLSLHKPFNPQYVNLFFKNNSIKHTMRFSSGLGITTDLTRDTSDNNNSTLNISPNNNSTLNISTNDENTLAPVHQERTPSVLSSRNGVNHPYYSYNSSYYYPASDIPKGHPLKQESEVKYNKQRLLRIIPFINAKAVINANSSDGTATNHILQYAAERNIRDMYVRYYLYKNLSPSTVLRPWTGEDVNKFKFFNSNYLGVGRWDKHNKACFAIIHRDILLASMVRNEDLVHPNQDQCIKPMISVEHAIVALNVLFQNYIETPGADVEWARNYIKSVSLPYDEDSQYNKEHEGYKSLTQKIIALNQSSTDPRQNRSQSPILEGIRSLHGGEIPTFNINDSSSYTQSAGLLLVLSNSKVKTYIKDLFNVFKRRISKIFTLTNIYVISILGLVAFLCKGPLIVMFMINMSLFSECFKICVPSSFIIALVKNYILDKIETNEYLKCPIYQFLLYISLLKILFIIAILLSIII